MISIKSSTDLAKMREAGLIAGRALKLAGESIKPGMTTKALDKIIHDYIISCGAKPSFLHYGGFPASACISINNEVIHGIPSHKRRIAEGDIVSVDVGAFYNGFHGDTCATFPCGKISEEAKALLEVTEQSLYEGIAAAKVGARLGMSVMQLRNTAHQEDMEMSEITADTGSDVNFMKVQRCRIMERLGMVRGLLQV